MPTPTVVEIVAALSPREQEAVRAFVEYLRQSSQEPASTARSPFLAAAEDFVQRHPELLRRLAQ